MPSTPVQPSIRPAEPRDVEAIVDVHAAAIRARGSDAYTDREVASWLAPGDEREGPDLDDPDTHVIVATVVTRDGEETDRVVGFGRLDLPDQEISAVYVHPDVDRQGVGTALLEALESEAATRGFERVSLYSSMNAVGFYERRGYQRVEQTTYETSDGVPLDVVLFEKALG